MSWCFASWALHVILVKSVAVFRVKIYSEIIQSLCSEFGKKWDVVGRLIKQPPKARSNDIEERQTVVQPNYTVIIV